MDIRRRNIGASIKGATGGGSSSSGTYTINLNGQWEKTTAVSNPDSTLYDGVYRSVSNYNVSGGVATMYINLTNCSTFKVYIRSYAESNYDYVMVSQLDQTIDGNTSYSNTTLVKAHTRGNQQSGTTLTSYTLVEFTGIGGGSHRITVVYRKDGSVNSGDDRGYVLIPYNGEGEDVEIDAANAIIYTSTDGKVVSPTITTGFSKNIVTNIYSNGSGIIQLSSPLKKLDNSGFENKYTLSTISLPDTTEEIGSYAFHNCNRLTTANIGSSVTSIGYYAFYNCSSLTSITIPDSVTSIEYCAFGGCTSLTSVTIPIGVTIIENSTFSCSGLMSITIPDSITSIGTHAFSSCTSLTSVTIPDSVTTIGSWAFSDCTSLPSLTIPIGVTEFGASVFNGFTGTLILNCETIPYSSISPRPFSGLLTDTIILGETVKTIDKYSLDYSDIKYINIPDNVTTIGESAFRRSPNLQEVNIGEGVISLNSGTFSECPSLNKLTVSKNFEDFGYSSYILSSETTNISLYCKPLTPPKNVINFTRISGKCTAYIPYESTYAYKYSHRWGYSSSTTISNKITIIPYDFINNQPHEEPTISDNELWYISYTDEVITPYSSSPFNSNILSNNYQNGSGTIKTNSAITNIAASAFYSTDNLVHVRLPNTVTSIGNSAFTSTDIYEITIPENVTSIGANAFDNCGNMLSVSLPEGLKTIGSRAFCNCYKIEYIRIPDTVTTIGDDAFRGCRCTLDLGNGCPTITTNGWGHSFTKIVGKYASSDNKCYIKDNVLILFASGSGLSSYSIPDGVKNIAKYAFMGCSSLENITIPNSVTSIGSWTFEYCQSLKNVYCKSITPPNGGSSMFGQTSADLVIYVPTSSVSSYKSATYWKDYADKIVGYNF